MMILGISACGGGDMSSDASEGSLTPDESPAGAQGPQGEEGVAGEPGSDGVQGPAGDQGAAGGSGVPDGVWLDGVNRIRFYTTNDGVVIHADDTSALAPATPTGAFNGGGTGNKALVGLNGYDGRLVSEISEISVTAKQDRNSSFFYMNMQVDCDGDGAWDPALDGIVVVDSDSLADFLLPADGSFTTIDINPGDSIFKMVGGPKASCGNLPPHIGPGSGSPVPLTDLPATALLFNGDIGDGGMPRDLEMAAILFVMNDSATKVARTMTIESITVNADDYPF
jgi:hypothetical protein